MASPARTNTPSRSSSVVSGNPLSPPSSTTAAATGPGRDTLILKVMRLTRPTLMTTVPVPCELSEGPGDFTAGQLQVGSVVEAPDMGVSEFLALPQSKGNSVYLGETFSALISIHNEGELPVTNVAIKAELQTASQRVSLVDTSKEPRATLAPGESTDALMTHDVKELGLHSLVCSVAFLAPSGDLRLPDAKRFSFKVLPPLAVKTKVHSLPDCVFLEAQMQNVTSQVMFVKSVRFEPLSTVFDAIDLNSLKSNGKLCESFSSTHGMLNPQEIRQYLYKLTPLENALRESLRSPSIGKIDIVWRTNLGEKGRLQTSQLPRKVPSIDELALRSWNAPQSVALLAPFHIVLQLDNNSDRKLSVRLNSVSERMEGLRVVGVSGQNVGEINSGTSASVCLTVIGVSEGLQALRGLRAVDLISGKNYDFDDVLFVNVTVSHPQSQ